MAAYILNSYARPRVQGDEAESIKEAFSTSLVNFTHFISTKKHPSADTIHELLHGIPMHQAELQLRFEGYDWDSFQFTRGILVHPSTDCS